MPGEFKKNHHGFTLVELLIVLGIIIVVSVLALPFASTFQVSTDLYTQAADVVKTLRKAQQNASAGQYSSDWGVYFDNGAKKVVLFQGGSYASRNQDFDQNLGIAQNFNLSTDFAGEMIFQVYNGMPSASGTVTILSQNNESKTILINSYGKIELGN